MVRDKMASFWKSTCSHKDFFLDVFSVIELSSLQRAWGPYAHKQTPGKPEMLNLQTFLFNRRDLLLFPPEGCRSGCWLVAWWSFTLCRARSHPNNPLFCVHCKRVYYYAYYKPFLPRPLSWALSSASRTRSCGRAHGYCTKDIRPCGR